MGTKKGQLWLLSESTLQPIRSQPFTYSKVITALQSSKTPFQSFGAEQVIKRPANQISFVKQPILKSPYRILFYISNMACFRIKSCAMAQKTKSRGQKESFKSFSSHTAFSQSVKLAGRVPSASWLGVSVETLWPLETQIAAFLSTTKTGEREYVWEEFHADCLSFIPA